MEKRDARLQNINEHSAQGLTIFPAGDVEQGLLVGVLAHQPEDRHVLALANPVAAGHGLQVILHSHRYTFVPAEPLYM